MRRGVDRRVVIVDRTTDPIEIRMRRLLAAFAIRAAGRLSRLVATDFTAGRIEFYVTEDHPNDERLREEVLITPDA